MIIQKKAKEPRLDTSHKEKSWKVRTRVKKKNGERSIRADGPGARKGLVQNSGTVGRVIKGSSDLVPLRGDIWGGECQGKRSVTL